MRRGKKRPEWMRSCKHWREINSAPASGKCTEIGAYEEGQDRAWIEVETCNIGAEALTGPDFGCVRWAYMLLRATHE